MLHTRVADFGLALWVRQFEPECSSCVRCTHNGLCAGCQHRSPVLVVKLAERIFTTAGQENGQENNRRNIKSNMENTKQENTQEVQQENNLLGGAQLVTSSEETTEIPQAVQLVQPKEAMDNMAEIERQYRETIERENR